MEPTTNKSRYDNNSFVNEFRSKLNISDYAMKAGAAANKLVVTTSMNKKALHRNYEGNIKLLCVTEHIIIIIK